jgi:hypothetical protein
MKYTKAVECDFCGTMSLSSSNSRFDTWFKFIGWMQTVRGDGITEEFCSVECYEHYKEEVAKQVKNNKLFSDKS